jgi:MFS family permease
MRRIRTLFIVIALSNLLWTLGFRVWESLFNNFAVEDLSISAGQIGLVQAIREVPGLVGFLVGMLALLLVETRIAGLSLLLMGVGIFLTGGTHSLPALIGATLVMSTGFHFFYSSNASAVLLAVGPEEAPQALGRLNSLSSLAAVIGTLFIFATLEGWGYRTLFYVTGAAVVLGGLVLLPLARQPRPARTRRQGMSLRRRYWLYYALQFLYGSRRHIFTTFAVYLLVRQYHVTAQTITLLFLINNLIGTYFNQAFGQIVARHGERRVLTVNFILLALIFIGYAFIPGVSGLSGPSFVLPPLQLRGWVLFPSLPVTPALLVLVVLFVADNVLVGFSMALECYLQKIALSAEEITPNVALGQTFNHIAAVIVPVVGGVMWESVGPQSTFLAGVVIALVALALTQGMRVGQPARGSCPLPVRPPLRR